MIDGERGGDDSVDPTYARMWMRLTERVREFIPKWEKLPVNSKLVLSLVM